MDKVLVIVGPTASGKSAMAVQAARLFDGEVISADSMQVYRGMDIGTAKITQEQMQGVPHHLLDICDPDEEWNVQRFQTLCRQKIAEITARGKLPIVCGGTGLYVKAALYDYSFEPEDPAMASMEEKLAGLSAEQLVAILEERDPGALEKIHPNNRKRLLRAALMSYSSTKKSERESAQQHAPVYDLLMIGLRDARSKEIERIGRRVDQMFEQGLPQEVSSVFSLPESRSWNSFQAIGYKEFAGWLDGDESLEQVREQIKVHTRQYARRQMTWFGNQMPVRWFGIRESDQILRAVKEWKDSHE